MYYLIIIITSQDQVAEPQNIFLLLHFARLHITTCNAVEMIRNDTKYRRVLFFEDRNLSFGGWCERARLFLYRRRPIFITRSFFRDRSRLPSWRDEFLVTHVRNSREFDSFGRLRRTSSGVRILCTSPPTKITFGFARGLYAGRAGRIFVLLRGD